MVYLIDPQGSGLFDAVNARLEGSEVGKPGEAMGKKLTWLPRSPGSTVAEGIGCDRKTANFAFGLDHDCIDGAMLGTDKEAVDMAYHLLRHDGIFVGPSAALNMVGAYRLAKHLGPGHTVVTVLCDGGDRYCFPLRVSGSV